MAARLGKHHTEGSEGAVRERRSGDRPDSPTTGPASAGPKAGSEADAKAELRRLMAARRGGSGPRAAQTGGAEIARRVLALPEVATAVWVAAFVGLPNEPDTRQLLAALRAHGTRVLLPAVREDLDLDFREFTGALVPGALGTREPPPAAPAVDLAAADVVLVPAVAVDRRGHRLGRGGGSYDRALRRVHPQAPLVAVVDDLAIVDGVPVDAHDLSVSVIVTPTQVVRRGPV